jgi:hypothetical protein
MPFVGLVTDPRWEPPEGAPDPDRRRAPRDWRFPWSLLIWTTVCVGLMLLVPVVSGAVGSLAGYLLVCFTVALAVWRVDRWFATQYWRGLRDYQS